MSTFALNKDQGYPLKTLLNGDNTTTLAVRPSLFSAPPGADSGTVEYPSPTTEIYRFRQGGISGNILMSVTVVYTDSTKVNIQSWSAS